MGGYQTYLSCELDILQLIVSDIMFFFELTYRILDILRLQIVGDIMSSNSTTVTNWTDGRWRNTRYC